MCVLVYAMCNRDVNSRVLSLRVPPRLPFHPRGSVAAAQTIAHNRNLHLLHTTTHDNRYRYIYIYYCKLLLLL